MKARHILCSFLSLAFFSVLVAAQTSTGQITGIVKDDTGAIIPGVEVTATRTATGEARTVVSTENGVYRFLNLQPGFYNVRAELSGFKTAVSIGLEVTTGGVTGADLVMSVGEITEEVTVEARPQTVNKEEGRVSQLVEAAEIQDLPLNGRNAYQLAQLGPGITPSFGRVAQSSGANAGDTFSANGVRHRGNNYLLDGTDNNYVGIAGIPTVTPQVDIIEEFRVHTNNFSAEFGRNAGAIVNVLTKSGSNEFHGTAYWFHRNDALDAREFFDADKAPLIQHTAGFTFGGPIWKDRTFFFGGLEVFRESSGESAVFQVETQQLLNWVRDNNPGSIADMLFQRFPLQGPVPTTGDDLGSPLAGVQEDGPPDGIPDRGDLSLFDASKDEAEQWNLRIDHVISDNDRLYGRFTRQVSEGPPTIVRASVDSVGQVTEQAFTFSETHVFSPTLVNEFRAGWNEREPNFDVQEGTFDVPTISISGFSPDFGAASNIPQFFARHTYQFSDQLGWARGDHSFKFGFEFRHGQENSDFQASTRGVYSFDTILDFVLDEPFSQNNLIDPGTGLPTGTPRHFRVNEWALYVQDDWKVTPNLTFNMGLRYESFRPPYEKDSIQANIGLGSGSNLFERLGSGSIIVFPRGTDIYEPDNNNFAPRLGFAWDPTGEGKWAVRGGYGISYNRIFMNITSNIKFNPPFALSVTANQNNQLPIRYTLPTTLDPGLIAGFVAPPFNPNMLDPDLGTTYVHSIFFGVQREIFNDWMVEANYVSTLGRKLYAQEHYNRFTGDRLDGILDGFNPAWNPAGDDFLTGSINQAYHSGQFSLNKRFRGGLGFRANYTWARNIDDDTDVFGATSDDSGASIIEDRKADRGLSSIHVGHRFAANWVWNLPWLRNHDNWFARNVLGGWQVNGLIALQEGTPTSIIADGSSFTSFLSAGSFCSRNNNPDQCRRGDFNADGYTADRAMAGSITSSSVNPADASAPQGLFAQFGPTGSGISTSESARLAFLRPAAGTNGNLGRNTFFLDGFTSVDFSLFKNFRMPWFAGEDATWQFRAEFFNLFNQINLNAWQEDIAATTFGRSTSAQDAREIQFALKFIF